MKFEIEEKQKTTDLLPLAKQVHFVWVCSNVPPQSSAKELAILQRELWGWRRMQKPQRHEPSCHPIYVPCWLKDATKRKKT